MKKSPSQRPGAIAASRSPNRSPPPTPTSANKSVRNNARIIKKIADAVDLLEKKQVTSARALEDQANNEIYYQVLHEKSTRKDAKFEKPNKKMIEAKKAEVAAMRGQLDLLLKDLELRRITLETLKAFFLHLIREFKFHIKGFTELPDRDKSDASQPVIRTGGKGAVGLRKSKSQNLMQKAVDNVVKAVHFVKTAKEETKVAPTTDDAVKAWTERRRSSMMPRKSRMLNTVGFADMENLQILPAKSSKIGGGVSSGSTEDADDTRGRTNTTRFQINQHLTFSPNAGVLNKSNVRKSVMNESDNLINLKDFSKMQKMHNKKSHAEIIDLLQSSAMPPPDPIEEEGSVANSNLSESIVEEVKEEMRMKLLKESHAEWNEHDAFQFKVVIPNFQPVKVSFKVGIEAQRGLPEKSLVVLKDRIFKGFAIHEIEWHFKNKSLCGVRVILKNWTTNFMLGGAFHGKIGDFVDVCKFNRNERIMKIEYAHDSVSMKFLEFVTTEGRRFVVGMDRKEATLVGLNFVNRYYPQEIMLCKFFCQFNKVTQCIDYIRFLFVRAVLY